MADYKSRFQQILRELFQFDAADLDFGIYRILNFKRDHISKFIEEDIAGIVDQAVSDYRHDQAKRISATKLESSPTCNTMMYVPRFILRFTDGS